MPNALAAIFPNRRALLVVVHATSPRQALDQSALALDAGADGVFLISHGQIKPNRLAHLADQLVRLASMAGSEGVRSSADRLVGVNLLGLSPAEAVRELRRVPRVRALWSDKCDARDDEDLAPSGPLFFGGAAFKYQREVPLHLVGVAAATAASLCDVVTTSGPATGEPPDPEKLRLMRAALGDHALAVASGVDADNVGAMLPHADAFLVASSLETSHGALDRGAVEELAAAIHEYCVS